jgi:hypothetical protein
VIPKRPFGTERGRTTWRPDWRPGLRPPKGHRDSGPWEPCGGTSGSVTGSWPDRSAPASTMLELPIIVIKASFTRIGCFEIDSRTTFWCFGVFKSFFERLVFAADRRHPVTGLRGRGIATRRRSLKVRRIDRPGIGQDRHPTPPRATREKPGKYDTSCRGAARSDNHVHFPRRAVVRGQSLAPTNWAGRRARESPPVRFRKPTDPAPERKVVDSLAVNYQCTSGPGQRPVTGAGRRAE